jgi:hypothetical protein
VGANVSSGILFEVGIAARLTRPHFPPFDRGYGCGIKDWEFLNVDDEWFP